MKAKSIWMKRALAVCLTAGMIVGLAGCGGGETTPNDDPGTKENGNAANSGDNESTESEVDYDAVITMALTSGWTDLIPYNNATGGMYSMLVLGQLYDPLVYVSGDGTISARAAKDWKMSEDHRTATFYLDENATWHDGCLLYTSFDRKNTFTF